MKNLIILVVLSICFTLNSEAQTSQNVVLMNGNFIKNGKEYQGERYHPEELEVSNRSSGCDDCQPDYLILPAQDDCPTCKVELCPGWLLPQLYAYEALNPDLEILEFSVFTLTFCQDEQLEYVVENGLPSSDATVYGKEGSNIIGEDFWLRADEFYMVELIVRNTDDDCPDWMRHQLKESFYVGTCCDDGNNVANPDTVVNIQIIKTQLEILVDIRPVDQTTGVSYELVPNSEYIASPVPTPDYVSLKKADGGDIDLSALTIDVVNVGGNVMPVEIVGEYLVDLTNFPSGIYYIRLIDDIAQEFGIIKVMKE